MSLDRRNRTAVEKIPHLLPERERIDVLFLLDSGGACKSAVLALVFILGNSGWKSMRNERRSFEQAFMSNREKEEQVFLWTRHKTCP